jgi:hypothetical protein
MIGFVPPAPLPEMMRRGALVRVSDKLGKRSFIVAMHCSLCSQLLLLYMCSLCACVL